MLNTFAKKSSLAAVLVAAIAVSGVSSAQAQNFLNTNLSAMNDQFNARLNADMARRQRQIVQGNLTNPQVMAAYRAGVCGYGLTPEQFALKYATMGGCTAQGYANYNAASRQIAANEAAALGRYREAQAARANAMAVQQQHFSNNQYRAGMMLGGWRYAPAPGGGYYWYR